MQVMGMGLSLKGDRLFAPIDSVELTQRLIGALDRNSARIRGLSQAGARGVVFRGEQARTTLDAGDPLAAGWTFLVGATDPKRAEIVAALQPLAVARGMVNPAEPLVFGAMDPTEWGDWLNDSYFGLEVAGKKVPRYVLIAGGPDQVPFGVQSLLDGVANVGRLDFDQVEDLATYAAKVLRIEAAPSPLVTREAIVFAPDGGPNDPTHYSRRYMAEPLADVIQNDLHLTTKRMIGDQATKANLAATFVGATPAIVYSASHGLGAVSEPLNVQQKYNGAICCQHQGGLTMDALFGADDVPANSTPFLEGAIFFQFACYGYGTPAVSDYAHWLNAPGKETRNADRDFVAAFPKRLLAHPNGPIAFIGHLDTAFLHGFADVDAIETLDRWHTRVQPYLSAVKMLLGVQPSGLALQAMNERYATYNALLANTHDRIQRGRMQWTPELEARFLDTWITRGDAQNYMVLGDPAARLRLPEA